LDRRTEEVIVKKIVVVVATVAVSIVLTSCSSSTSSDPDLDAWTREVRVITPDQVGDRQYEEISGLEEQERIGAMGEDQAISTAKQRLRRRAAALDADAVVIIACGRNVRPIEDDRLMHKEPTVVCHGIAIRWKDN
jgi:hypothetical protein